MAIQSPDLTAAARALEAAAGEVAQGLEAAMQQVANRAAETLRRVVPKRSRRLANSVRPGVTAGRAHITAGGGVVDYAPTIQWGLPERGIQPAGYVQATDAAMADDLTDIVQRGWEDIAERQGLL